MRFTLERLKRALGLRPFQDLEAAAELADRGELHLGDPPGFSVEVSPQSVRQGDWVEVRCRGSMDGAWAEPLHVHYGFGPGPWRSVQDQAMQKESDGAWSARILADQAGSLEFCFHDGAGRWANRGGKNWHVPVEAGSEAP